ncbi:hypothetical protein ACFVVU_03355 [Kitasatospora sp. NPDC057965]|uniref:hypothetical protein n=1 Tax=Kitasatospora sp. NPDC057965 TaxID=3346291 RepID=UPI0036D99CAF
MKSRGYGRGWYDGRLPGWLRGLVVLAAGWGVLLCGQEVAEGYRATMVYRAASACEVGSQEGKGADGAECVGRRAVTVLDRRKGEHCTSNGGGGAGGAETGGGVGGTSCTPYYEVKVEWPDRIAWLDVSSETYGEVREGDPAEVRLWHDEVVALKVRGHTHSYAPSSESGVLVWIALGCLILAAGAWGAVSGRLSGLIAFPNFGWLFVAFGVGMLGSMALFGGPLLLWGFMILWTGFAVFWIVGAWRTG